MLVVSKSHKFRGETIAKVFRKVDTFCTYQLPQAQLIACPQAIQLKTECDKRTFTNTFASYDVYILSTGVDTQTIHNKEYATKSTQQSLQAMKRTQLNIISSMEHEHKQHCNAHKKV